MTLLQRFLVKVRLPSDAAGCWEWLGSMRNEYGSFHDGRATRYAHQIAYILYRGELKPGLKLLHSCDNPICVNPNHLTQDTQSANVRDAIRKGRIKPFQQTRAVGPSNADSEAIKRDARNGMSQRQLASKYNMATTSVRRVLGLVGH